MLWNQINSVKTFNVKFTQKTKFIFLPLSIHMNFQIFFPFILNLFFFKRQSVWSYFRRYQSLWHAPSHQNFGCYDLVFGKCVVTPTSPISWFLSFNKYFQLTLISILAYFESRLYLRYIIVPLWYLILNKLEMTK